MKKILFVIPEYSHGGTNKSLDTLVAFLDKKEFCISICCLYEDGGDFYKKKFSPYVIKKSRLYYLLHDNSFTRKIMGLYNKLTRRDNFEFLYKREVRYIQKHHDFDVVVGYQEGLATVFTTYFENVRTIAWIHCDYGAWSRNTRRAVDNACYSVVNEIVCVSESARRSFLTLFPDLEQKTHAIYNLLNIDEIKAKALEKPKDAFFTDERFRIVSVGRLDEVKQFERIPLIASLIKKNTKKRFCWYILGSGLSEGAINSEISKHGVEDVVRLLGAKDNPYPYISNANLLACTSKSESFSYVIAEAKLLHIPVISTDFPVATEVMTGILGWVSDLDSFPQTLSTIIDSLEVGHDMKDHGIVNYGWSNDEALKKIYSLFLD